MSIKAKICRETAEAQLQKFKDFWGYEDPKEIVSGGAESSFPEGVKERILASIMLGRTEVTDKGEFTHTLKQAIGDLTQVKITPVRMKQHERRRIMDGVEDEFEIGVRMLEICSDVTEHQLSEMATSDVDTILAITGIASFI